jgi:hypothetical protein
MIFIVLTIFPPTPLAVIVLITAPTRMTIAQSADVLRAVFRLENLRKSVGDTPAPHSRRMNKRSSGCGVLPKTWAGILKMH